MSRFSGSVLLCLTIILGAIAPTATWGQLQKRGVSVEHTVAVTLSPIQLRLPIVEITAEFRVASGMGIAATGGLGSVKGFSAWKLGGGLNFYTLGDIERGVQLGVEAFYMQLAVKNSSNQIAQIYSQIPFVGYKFTANSGLTISAAIGYTMIALESDPGNNQDLADALSKANPLTVIRLNLGWSF